MSLIPSHPPARHQACRKEGSAATQSSDRTVSCHRRHLGESVAAKAVADGLGNHPDFPFYWFRAIIKTPTWYAGVRDELEILSPETVWMSAPEYFELLRCWLEEQQTSQLEKEE